MTNLNKFTTYYLSLRTHKCNQFVIFLTFLHEPMCASKRRSLCKTCSLMIFPTFIILSLSLSLSLSHICRNYFQLVFSSEKKFSPQYNLLHFYCGTKKGMSVWVHACVCECLHKNAYISVCMCLCECVHKNAYISVCICVCVLEC